MPGREPPSASDMRCVRTHKEIILGIDLDGNQLLAIIDDEFKLKTLPAADKIDPSKHQAG